MPNRTPLRCLREDMATTLVFVAFLAFPRGLPKVAHESSVAALWAKNPKLVKVIRIGQDCIWTTRGEVGVQAKSI